jgi:hypothetical protein
MKKPRWFLYSGRFFVALIMLLLLGACAKVKVTCPPGGGGAGGGGDSGDIGGCNPPVAWQNQSADGFYRTDNGQRIPQGSGLVCSGGSSTKCQSSPGNCGWNKTCKNWYRPSDSFCYCGCP